MENLNQLEDDDFYLTAEGYKVFTRKYHLKRGYLKNYLTFLREQENKNKIKILKIQKVIGGETDDCWTFLIWKKNNQNK